MMRKPNWILLKECGKKLTKEGKAPFSRKQLIDCVHEKHHERGEGSLNPMIQGMTVNAKGGAPGGLGKNIFYRVSPGRYELYKPEKHGPTLDTSITSPTERKTSKPFLPAKVKEAPYEETKTTEDQMKIDEERGRKLASLLLREFATTGPENLMPKGMKRGSLDHLLFITLTVSIDYMRDADELWESARKTYEDPKTKYLFDPESLDKASDGKVLQDLGKHGLSKKPEKDSRIWRTVGLTFYKKWDGGPRNFLEDCGWDALKVIERLKRHPSWYPYLRGRKIRSLWLRMLRDIVGLSKLKNLDKIPIPVDRHVARATLTTGVVRGTFEGRLEEIFRKVREAWFRSVKGLSVGNRPIIALDVDEPLWHLSKYGCAMWKEVTGDCPAKGSCKARDFCVKGKIIIQKNKALVETYLKE